MPKVNVPEIKDLQAWIEEQAALPVQQSAWAQAVWIVSGENIGRECGTAYCAAGRTVEKHQLVRPMPSSAMVVVPDPQNWDGAVRYHSGEDLPDIWAVTIDDAARQILGLTETEARDLFRGANDLDDMRRAFAEILERAEQDEANSEVTV